MSLKRSILGVFFCGAVQCCFSLPPATDATQPVELSSQPSAVATSSLQDDLLKKINSLEQQVQQLQGQVDVVKHDLRKTQEQLDKKIVPAATAVPPAVPPVAVPKPMPLVEKTAAVTMETQEKNTYEAAYSLISAHAYSDAGEALTAYLKIYGEDGRYAANAHYWICELRANEQKYPEAVQCFEALITHYPSSNKAPDALLKLGMINKRLGNDDKAHTWLKRLLQEFPQSPAAKLAKEYM